MREREVIAKIKADLDGAVEHWQERMTSWSFVHNNNQGLTAKVVQALDDLRAAYPAIEINVWAWPQIREQFNRLSDDALADLYGVPPNARSLDQLDFSQLRPVIEQIARERPDPLVPLGNPPSSAKLEKNSLDADSAEFLMLGRGRVRLVEEYFAEHHDPNLGDQIAQAMQAQYRMLVDTGIEANEVLVKLQQFAGWGRRDSSHNAAVLAVVVYFFDRCDIFEDPDEQDLETARAEP